MYNLICYIQCWCAVNKTRREQELIGLPPLCTHHGASQDHKDDNTGAADVLTQPSDDEGEIFKWCQNNVGEHDTSVFTAARTLQHSNTLYNPKYSKAGLDDDL